MENSSNNANFTHRMAPPPHGGLSCWVVRRGGRHRQLLLACLLRAGCPGCAAAADHRLFAWCWLWRRVRRRCCCGIVGDFAKRGLAAFLLCGRCSPLPIRPCKRPMKPTIICGPTLSLWAAFDFDARAATPRMSTRLMDAFLARGSMHTPQRAWARTLTRTPSNPTTPQATPF